jgi:hypothetical protein
MVCSCRQLPINPKSFTVHGVVGPNLQAVTGAGRVLWHNRFRHAHDGMRGARLYTSKRREVRLPVQHVVSCLEGVMQAIDLMLFSKFVNVPFKLPT